MGEVVEWSDAGRHMSPYVGFNAITESYVIPREVIIDKGGVINWHDKFGPGFVQDWTPHALLAPNPIMQIFGGLILIHINF